MRVSVIRLLVAIAAAVAVVDETDALRSVSVVPSSSSSLLSQISRGGAEESSSSSSSYALQLEAVKETVLSSTLPSIDELRKSIINEATTVDDFGPKADTIVNKALEEFASKAPTDDDDHDSGDLYETKLEQIEAALDAPLQVLYLKQLQLLREQALLDYRKNGATGGGTSEYEAMLQADAYFVREAELSTRDETADAGDGGWDFTSERTALQSIMNRMAETNQKITDVQIQSAKHQQTAMQFLQSQAQMIQQLQMQLYGQTSPWNVGVAYRIPDTNFNLQGSYQQGKTNVQLSCVPDEYASFLGPNGFTNGVGPGNLGLSLNLSA